VGTGSRQENASKRKSTPNRFISARLANRRPVLDHIKSAIRTDIMAIDRANVGVAGRRLDLSVRRSQAQGRSWFDPLVDLPHLPASDFCLECLLFYWSPRQTKIPQD
jgi:hypothetical protein